MHDVMVQDTLHGWSRHYHPEPNVPSPIMYIPSRIPRMVTVSTMARILGPFVVPFRSWPRHVHRPFTSSAITRDQGLKSPESALKAVSATKSLRLATFPRTAACLII